MRNRDLADESYQVLYLLLARVPTTALAITPPSTCLKHPVSGWLLFGAALLCGLVSRVTSTINWMAMPTKRKRSYQNGDTVLLLALLVKIIIS